MKIISNFKDYYDSLQRLGTDKNVIYNRTTISSSLNVKDETYFNKINYPHKELSLKEIIEDIHPISLLKQIVKHKADKTVSLSKINKRSILNCFVIYDNSKEKNKYYCYKSILFLCGKVYPVITIVQIRKQYQNFNEIRKVEHLYNIDNFNKFCIKNKIIPIEDIKLNLLVKDWFQLKIDVNDFLIANKVISVFMCVDESKYDHYLRKQILSFNEIIINPCLDQLMFQKVMDAQTMYQELDMYISGTLSYPQNLMVEIPNEERIVKHGFDLKTSFRKRKNKAA